MIVHSFCDDWEFTRRWTEAFGKGLPVPKQQTVRLPHTCRELPLHYAAPSDYEMVCGYRKRFRVPPVQAAPRLFLRFDGAAHQASVFVNGKPAGTHAGGYTGFELEITGLVDRDGENLLTVRLDTREDPSIPPFGFVIDYLTYGGLYREVWLEVSPKGRLTDLFVYTPSLKEAVVQWTAEHLDGIANVRVRLEDAAGRLLAEQTADAAPNGTLTLPAPKAQPWSTEDPQLCRCTAELLDAAGHVTDRRQVSFGFRTAVFRRQLNGRAYGSDPDVFFLREENCRLTAEQKKTLAAVNALLGQVFLTSDMPARYTGQQRAEYCRMRALAEQAEQVQVETEEDGAFCIRYRMDGKAEQLRFRL